ncbi:hypothetical protein R7Q48_08070 [Vibrio sp. 378]|nr:hypothetical protein [Vibrio sp. 378]MDW2146551.1 hypothetical protein [Vibrio sp. 378]
MKYLSLTIITLLSLSGCSAFHFGSETPEDKALKLCGLGISQQARDILKLSIQRASSTPGFDFVAEANKQIDTQSVSLLKQADLTDNESLKIVVEEIRAARECAVNRVAIELPVSKASLQEACRKDVERKLSPDGRRGALRNWNTADGQLIGSRETVEMYGEIGSGCSVTRLIAMCDFSGNTFNESVIRKTKSDC